MQLHHPKMVPRLLLLLLMWYRLRWISGILGNIWASLKDVVKSSYLATSGQVKVTAPSDFEQYREGRLLFVGPVWEALNFHRRFWLDFQSNIEEITADLQCGDNCKVFLPNWTHRDNWKEICGRKEICVFLSLYSDNIDLSELSLSRCTYLKYSTLKHFVRTYSHQKHTSRVSFIEQEVFSPRASYPTISSSSKAFIVSNQIA